MKASGQLGRLGALAVLGLGAAEVLMMISPFAGFFYARLQFEPLLGLLSRSPWTAWLDGFFLNHSVVTTSALLEWQRDLGLVLFLLGVIGFFLSAVQVYGNKLTGRGVATGVLYRYLRHPQYLCLVVAGWGLLTMWPRFLLLGIWVTMCFLYAGLARFEERRMEERFGHDYRRFADTRGVFLPGSPVRRLFEASLGRLHPRPLAWATSYALCLALAFGLAFLLRDYTRESAALLWQPDVDAVVVSTWPQPESWLEEVFSAANANGQVQARLAESQADRPVVATILAPRYGMKDMYYEPAPGQPQGEGGPLMGVNPAETDEPVEVVFSRAQKPYREELSLEEALDADVRLTPLVVVEVSPATGEVLDVRISLPQNHWGSKVTMPVF